MHPRRHAGTGLGPVYYHFTYLDSIGDLTNKGILMMLDPASGQSADPQASAFTES